MGEQTAHDSLKTRMVGMVPFKPREITVSTVYINPQSDPSQRYWETMVFNTKTRRVARGLFDYTRAGDQRDKQHSDVVGLLEIVGYERADGF